MKILFLISVLFSVMIFGASPKEGMALYRENKYEDAAPIFREIIRETPINYPMYKYLIESLFQIEEYAEALVYIRRLENSSSPRATKSLDYETYVKVLIEMKDLEPALKKANKGLRLSTDIITSNHLKRLKYLILVELQRFPEAEEQIKSETGWQKNPLLLYYLGEMYFHGAGEELNGEKLAQGLKYFSESYTASKETANINTENLVIDYLIEKAQELKGLPQRLTFLKDVKNSGIDSPRIEKWLKKYTRTQSFKKDLAELNLLLTGGSLKPAEQLLFRMEKKYPEKKLGGFRRKLETKKKALFKKLAIYISGGLGTIVIIFLTISGINTLVKKIKARPKKEKIKKPKIEKVKKEKAKKEKIKKDKAKKESPAEIEPEPASTSSQDVAVEEITSSEEEQAQDTAAVDAEESESITEEESATEKEPEAVAEEEPALAEEPEAIELEPEPEKALAEAASEDEDKAPVDDDEKISSEEAEAEPDTVPDEKDKPAELSREEILSMYLEIASDGDADAEKQFVIKHKSDEMMPVFKNIHFYFAGNIKKVLDYMKKADISENIWWLSKIIDFLEEGEVDSLESAAILYLYYKNTSDKDKEEKYRELGKKLRNESQS